MAPNVVSKTPDQEIASNGVTENKEREAKDVEEAEEQPWYQKYKTQLLITAVVVVILIIVISVTATNNGGSDGDRAIDAPTAAPSGDAGGDGGGECDETLDKDCDGLVEWACKDEPFFDAAGRLIFSGCAST